MVSDVKSDDGDTSMYKAKLLMTQAMPMKSIETTDEWEDALLTDWLSLKMILVRLGLAKPFNGKEDSTRKIYSIARRQVLDLPSWFAMYKKARNYIILSSLSLETVCLARVLTSCSLSDIY